MQTRLTELLGIEHPVMLAGMGGVSYHQLAAAVSEAGGIGTLGAATMNDEVMDAEMAAMARRHRQALGRRPADRHARRHGRPRSSGSSTPGPGSSSARWACPARSSPCATTPTCWWSTCADGSTTPCWPSRPAATSSSPRAPRPGGHTGRVATLPLVPQIVDAVGDRVPVVAAGGIVDGRGMAAALALGADGVWLGTRFIATPEARVSLGYHDALLAADESRTTVSRAYSGKPMRVLANTYTEYYDHHPEELVALPRADDPLDHRRRAAPAHRPRRPRCRPGPRVLPERTGRGGHRRPGAGGRAGRPAGGRGRGAPCAGWTACADRRRRAGEPGGGAQAWLPSAW